MKKLGMFMKEKREAMGLSLRDASRLSGVSHTHIRDIEEGRSIPSFEMVMRFLKAYMVEIGEFLQQTGYLTAALAKGSKQVNTEKDPCRQFTQDGRLFYPVKEVSDQLRKKKKQ